MKISPFAGKPAETSMLVNVPKLITAYYTEVPNTTADFPIDKNNDIVYYSIQQGV